MKNKGRINEVEERLDRAMATSDWLSMFPNASLKNILAATSDHSPILLQCNLVSLPFNNRKFKFENVWLQEPDLNDVVMLGLSCGDPNLIMSKLECCADELFHRGEKICKRYREDINNCKRRMVELRHKNDSESMEHFNNLRERLVTLILQRKLFGSKRPKLTS